jgi:hypothetical protein
MSASIEAHPSVVPLSNPGFTSSCWLVAGPDRSAIAATAKRHAVTGRARRKRGRPPNYERIQPSILSAAAASVNSLHD